MGLVNVSLPVDGTTADVADYNVPINTIVNTLNGNIDSDNVSTISSTKITKDTNDLQGWISGQISAPNTVAYNGNRSYTLTFNSTDLTGTVSPGMRIRTTRTVTAPTQCTSLNGSTQYFNKTSPAGMTFTDDFVVSAWIKLNAYGTACGIISRYNGTSGWYFRVETDGTVKLAGHNAGSGNFSYVQTYQSIPLNKWVHVAAQLDMSTFTATTTTSYVMIDGVNAPATVSRAGTNPTALVQAGNLEVGSSNGASFFNGKIAQAAVYSAKVTQANVVARISQGLSGSETNLISAYSFNNSINDLNTTNANNLSAQGSAVATNADSPFATNSLGTPGGSYDYGIVTSCTFSTNTTMVVQVPEGNTIPTSGGVATVVYSTQKAPYGMPVDEGKYTVISVLKYNRNQATPTINTGYNVEAMTLTYPIGFWIPTVAADLTTYRNTNGSSETILVVSATANTTTQAIRELTYDQNIDIGSATSNFLLLNRVITSPHTLQITAATTYYVNIYSGIANQTEIGVRGDRIYCYHAIKLALL